MLSSCAFYNTFYLARKYYFKATDGAPYEVDHENSQQGQNYSKAIDYAKKVISDYPKSKWVDDAYLLWAKALVGRDDPLQTVTMLQDFPVRFAKSELRAESAFFLALAYRDARRYPQAVSGFDEFLTMAPKHPLVPYAHLERARALVSLKRYGEAAAAAGEILQHYPNSPLVDRARRQRAEAYFQEGDYKDARADFHAIGQAALNDEERFAFVMREADCLEAARSYDEELSLLNSELSHTAPPAAAVPGQIPDAASEHYGKITLRIGTAELLAGHTKEALEQFDHVFKDYPKTALSAEAQYRTAYTYETANEDFDRALQEYAKVKEQFGQTPFAQQAQQRADNLARITQYRKGAGADSLDKKAEASFLTAELYLFQLDKPERALEEYGKVVAQYPGTPVAGRALNAEAWVLSRKLDRKAAADSLFWKVVHDYPATEAQIAARDYLEAEGAIVPDSLIVLPKEAPPPPPDTSHVLVPPPVVPPLGIASSPGDTLLRVHPRYTPNGARYVARDSLGRPIMTPGGPGMPPGMLPPGMSGSGGATPPGAVPPSAPSAPRDTMPPPPPVSPTPPAPRDSTPPIGPAPRDTTHKEPGR